MALEEELAIAEQSIATDSYSMSVGELVSSYKDGEITINPDFQRFFRWTPFQKSRLIESFLLGLPIPPIFVFQTAAGKWDLIDGLQRTSTVLEFLGELVDDSGVHRPPLVLTETKYLPSLSGVSWLGDADGKNALPEAMRLRLRKARVDVKIILPRSNETSKFELFDRLNTGGTPATSAEVRNCLILMKDVSFYRWLDGLASHPSFISTIPLTERQEAEQYRHELLVRYFVLKAITSDEARRILDLESFLNERILDLANTTSFDRALEATRFKSIFDRLERIMSDGAFRRYLPSKDSHSGAFLLAAYEVIALGIAANYDNVAAQGDNWLLGKARDLWRDDRMKSVGLRASQRLAQTIPLGQTYFA